MEKLDVEKIQSALGDWGELPAQFQQLTPDQQKSYLIAQGYQRFPDLLAHVTAWWERGMQLIEQYRVDAAFSAPPVEVDEFNAKAVNGVLGKDTERVRQAFEDARLSFLKLVAELDGRDQQDERIVRQLEMEIIGHYQEHRITKPADE